MIPEFHERARQAVVDVWVVGVTTGRVVAEYYGLSLQVVYACRTEGYDMGTVNARRVMRVEMARRQAEKNDARGWMPGEKDRYKGTRGR